MHNSFVPIDIVKVKSDVNSLFSSIIDVVFLYRSITDGGHEKS